MTVVLNQWDILDPFRMLKDIEAAHGSAIFDAWAYLDPTDAAKQLGAALGVTVSNAALLDSARFISDVQPHLGGAYVAKAVHHARGVNVYNNSLVGPSTISKCIVSFCFLLPTGSLTEGLQLWGVQKFNMPGGLVNPVIQTYAPFSSSTDLGAMANDAANANRITIDTGDGVLAENTWYKYQLGIDSQNGVIQQYLNGSPVGTPALVGSSFDMTLAGQFFGFSDLYSGFQPPVEFADFQFYQGVSDVASNLHLFINSVTGKPVDPSIAVAALGTPLVLCSGDISTFAENQGNGGALLVEQSLTLSNGSNGIGPVTAVGTRVGQAVVQVFNNNDASNISSDFEAIISVDDQIQQLAATDYSSTPLGIILPGTLTNATTSPSD